MFEYDDSMSNEGLTSEQVGSLVREADKPEKVSSLPLELMSVGDLSRELKRLVKESGALGETFPIKESFLDQSRRLILELNTTDEGLDPVKRRMMATQLVVLYEMVVTDRLNQMYAAHKAFLTENNKLVPEDGSEEEFAEKVGLATNYLDAISRRYKRTRGVGIEIEYLNAVNDLLGRFPGNVTEDERIKLEAFFPGLSSRKFALANMKNNIGPTDSLNMLDVLGASETGFETGKTPEVRTVPGGMKQQLREIASIVALGELAGKVKGGRKTWNIHFTLDEVELTLDDTEAMWIAPILRAAGVDYMEKAKLDQLADGAMVHEKNRRQSDSINSGTGEVGVFFPYHYVRQEYHMKRAEGEEPAKGLETRSWLRVAIPEGDEGMAELLKLAKAADFVEWSREMVLANHKPADERSEWESTLASCWKSVRKGIDEILVEYQIPIPGEGDGQMYTIRSGKDYFNALGNQTVYDILMNDLLKIRATDPVKAREMQQKVQRLMRQTTIELAQMKKEIE